MIELSNKIFNLDKKFINNILLESNLSKKELPAFNENFYVIKENNKINAFFGLKLDILNNLEFLILEYCWMDEKLRGNKKILIDFFLKMKKVIQKFETDYIIIDAKKHLENKIFKIVRVMPYSSDENNSYFYININNVIR